MANLSSGCSVEDFHKIDKEEIEAYKRMAQEVPLKSLMEKASQKRDDYWGKVITYSRKIFVPLTNMCRDTCSYCTFVKHPDNPEAKIMSPEEVLSLIHISEPTRQP